MESKISSFVERYHLFEIKINEDAILIRVSKSLTMRILISQIDNSTITEELDKIHRQRAQQLELNELYPYLYVSRHGIWSARTGIHDRDDSAMSIIETEFDLTNPDHAKLSRLNKAAEKSAKDMESFFCSICHKSLKMKDFFGSNMTFYLCNSCAKKDEKSRNIVEPAKKND